MNSKAFALFAIIVLQTEAYAQRVEPGTGYWYEGVVTHENGKATVSANEPRSLRQAMEAVAEEYGWTVDYEDLEYGDSDVIERTEAQFVASHPNERHHLVAGHRFETEFAEATSMSAADEKAVLEKIISDYNRSANPGRFSLLEEGGGRFAVIGKQAKNDAPLQGILDSPISVDIKNSNGAWALSKICESLSSASGRQVRLGRYPMNVLVQTAVNLQMDNRPAREVLLALVAMAPQKLMWSVLYDFDDKAYFLNLVPVAKSSIAPNGERTRQWVH
jgi:hypothetical protein